MHIVFIEPRFPANQKQFIRGLAEIGVTISAIGERSKETLDDELRHWLTHYEEVTNVCDEKQVLNAVKFIQRHKHVDRLEATVEAHIMPCAHVREAAGIPGTTARTAYLCRDKPAMKEILRAGGVSCAESTAASTADEVREFVARVGYPVMLKPRDGAGASGAARADTDRELEAAMRALDLGRPGRSIAVEEYIEGHEGFYDTMTLKGRIVHDFATHYYPNVLEAMRTRWISPQFVTTNRIDQPGYDEVKAMGQKVVTLLGIETSATHMEWFSGPKGLKFSEIGCRPPGVRAWDLYNVANDMDLYREWGMFVAAGRVSQRPSRRLATGIIALRPDRDGRIAGYEGLGAVREAFGDHLIDWYLPPEGSPTQGVEAGYMANAWVRMKHENYDHLRHMLDMVGRTVKVRAHG
ncbi:MAG: ATP-grasp domain-containing protein [Deltaproteobacteria bacterium]|nr:ATP-grasp domain-containing protein [Deltaproteobacteria bacterium]MDQ3295961.1 ATP-grasp domain-containing protein [Myxococcota bacterium]